VELSLVELVTNSKMTYIFTSSLLINYVYAYDYLCVVLFHVTVKTINNKLDCLDFSSYYEILEVSVLRHYQKFSINILHFIHSELSPAKVIVQQMLDTAAMKFISASQRIFMSRKCSEWFSPDLLCLCVSLLAFKSFSLVLHFIPCHAHFWVM